MLLFQKTTVYKKAQETADQIIKLFTPANTPLKQKIHRETASLISNIAKALPESPANLDQTQLYKASRYALSTIALLDTANTQSLISKTEQSKLTEELAEIYHTLNNFQHKQKKILILSAEVGQGHNSAAVAIEQAIKQKYGYDFHTEIVDFMELLNTVINLLTKKSYEKTVKFAPSLYKLFYEGSNSKNSIVKLLNQINYPFVLNKIRNFFEEKNPHLLISTFPVWDYIASDIWKKYRKDSKFISVITDSITIHKSWILGNVDYHIVANNDTAESLRALEIPEEKIKILGFPVKPAFLKETNKIEFLKKNNLNPDNFTVLFLPTSQNHRKNQQILKEINEKEKNINLIVICGRDNNIKFKQITPTESLKIIGWTNQMPEFIKSADIILTKAGGATVMECIAAGKPVIITSAIPGQEQGNVELIKRYKLGLIADSPSHSITEHIDYIRDNYDFFQNNIAKVSNPKAAENIAEFINTII